MRLKNKKTGEVIETDYKLSISIPNDETLYGCKAYDELKAYGSLTELNEEWEDYYEEPKEHWYIDWDGKLMASADEEGWEAAISIGNYFSSREEAEKAVEELRAFKRLKDKGFRFTGWEDLGAKLDMEDLMIFNREVIDTNNVIGFRIDDYRDCIKNLDICFGGEE